jgi:protein-disulfide isomerase
MPLMYRFAVIGLLCAATAAQAQEAPDRAARVNGTIITAAEVDQKLGNALAKLQEQIFSLRQKQLEALIDQQLLEEAAKSRGLTLAALVQAEITAKATPATSEEAARFYAENKGKLQGELAALEPQILTYLTAQRLQARKQELLKTLRSSATIELFLAAPPAFRSEVSTAGAPVRGRADAPVTVVEFSDFHCPFCRKVQPVLDQVRAKYGDQIKLVYRDYPIDNLHPQARAASEAAACAAEQGKFWEFHDKMFQNDPDASPAALGRRAGEIGMNVAAFEACRVSGKYRNAVQASNQEGSLLGITGTPTFFINGRMLVGAQPLEVFAAIIDAELALVKGGRQ